MSFQHVVELSHTLAIDTATCACLSLLDIVGSKEHLPAHFYTPAARIAQVARSLKHNWQAGWQNAGLGSNTSYD